MNKVNKHLAISSLNDVLTFYKSNVLVLLLIAIVSIIAYAPSLGGQFLSADDIPAVVQNQALRNFWQTAKSLNLASIHASFLINVFGITSVPFHISALVFHILNSFLVLLLTYLLFGRRPALYASLIFCVLPAGSEAVFWITGVGYVFNAFFALLCLNLYFIFRSTHNIRFLIASLAVYLLSLVVMQTPWMLTVPFILVSLDLFTQVGRAEAGSAFRGVGLRSSGPATRKARQLPWYYFMYLLCSAVYWLVWVKGRFAGRMTILASDYYFNPAESTPLLKRLPYTIYKAVELYVFPLRLSFFHEETLSTAVYALMVTVSVLIILLVVYLMYKRSKYAGLLLAIIMSLAPTFSPVQVAWFMAERYLYLGGAFFAMLLSLIILKIDYKYSIKHLAGYIVAFVLALYSLRVFTRAYDFRTSKTLWLATQKTAPLSYRVYNNLGDVYSNEQDWQAAITSFQTSIKLNPNYADAIHNLGYTYMQVGDYENAKKYLLESYTKNTRLYQALVKLGKIEELQGNKQSAEAYYQRALEINPTALSR